MAFAHGKLVDPQESGRRQRLLLFLLQSSLLQSRADQGGEALASKTRTNVKAASHLLHRLRERVLSDGFTQAYGGSPARTTGAIGFCKGSGTLAAAKATLEDDQFDRILPQADISLHALAAIMDLIAEVLTVRTWRAVRSCHHFQAQASIFVLFLRQQAKFGQVQGDHDPFLGDYLFDAFFGMLRRQGLFLLILSVVFFSSSTNFKPVRLLLGLFLLWINSSFPLKDGES